MSQRLAHILSKITVLNSNWDDTATASVLSFDSREVNADTLFFALKGSAKDGHKYLDQVVANGCKNIVVQNDAKYDGVNVIRVEDTAAALSIAAHNFYDCPSDKVKLIGITGTNGKRQQLLFFSI